MQRQSGRTTRMIQGLPETGAIVVVPNAYMVSAMQRDIFEIRGGTVATLTTVVAVEGPSDLKSLMGQMRPIRLDHTAAERLDPETLAKLALLQSVCGSSEERI